jgi:hypothetical protein
LFCAAGLWVAGLEYQAGIAAAGGVKALALEDRRGNRAVIAEGDRALTRQISDLVAVEVMKEHGLDRGVILLRGTGSRPAATSAFLDVIRAAFQALAPAALRSTGDTLYLSWGPSAHPARACLLPSGALELSCAGSSAAGSPVLAPILGVFQMVDLTHGLLKRGDPRPVYPVLAIAFGKQFAILALGGKAPVDEFRRAGVIVAPFSNDAEPFPEDPRVRTAIRQALSRIGR